MMLLLIADITNDAGQLRMSVRKRPKALLPRESAQHPSLPINEIRGPVLYIANQNRERGSGFQSNQQMRMVWHAMHRQKFLSTLRDDAGHIFVKFLFEFAANQALAGFDSKNDLEIDLGVSVGHRKAILETKGAWAS